MKEGAEGAALPDPRVLGWLLATQNVTQAIPTARLNQFVSGVLAEAPGVSAARLTIHAPEPRTSTSEPQVSAGSGDDGHFALTTSHGRYGEVVLEIGDRSSFEPYRAFVENYVGSLALLLENRRQREELEEALARLGRSERRYHQLFTEMAAGHAVHEIILDDRGVPRDYRFLEVNPAFERQTGLRAEQIVGKTVCEILPGIERSWIDRYGHVALTGEPCRFEDYNRNLDRHYDVIAYRPAPGQFAVVFSDVTERTRLQDRLREASLTLHALNQELQSANEELQAQNEELAAQQEELRAQNKELQEARQEAVRLHAEQRTVLQRLQETLVDPPRERPGIRFAHLYRSATREAQIGGDFYDVFDAKRDQVGLLIGDISGHGVEAARTALMVKDTIRAFSRLHARPHLVLRDTNLLLLDQNVRGFVTVFLGFLDPTGGRLVFSMAGHPSPLLLDGSRARPIEQLNVPLGVFRDAHYKDVELVLLPGQVLLLYTDGVTEARVDRAMFGETGLASAAESLRGAALDDLPRLLFEEALRFSRGELADDAAILAVRYEGLPDARVA